MKPRRQTISILAAIALSPFAFADHHEKGGDHDHAEHKAEAGHGDHDGHDHGDHAKEAGPNGGRVLHEFEPHAEFFVTAERKIQITILGEDGKAAAPGDQKVTAIAGQRSKPTKLTFTKTATGFLSDAPLPAGNNIPAVITIRTGEEKARAKFNINLDDCPTCDFKEYACTCDHGEEGDDDHNGHDHD